MVFQLQRICKADTAAQCSSVINGFGRTRSDVTWVIQASEYLSWEELLCEYEIPASMKVTVNIIKVSIIFFFKSLNFI